MNETIKTILSRRSCRAFTEESVSESDIQALYDKVSVAFTNIYKLEF